MVWSAIDAPQQTLNPPNTTDIAIDTDVNQRLEDPAELFHLMKNASSGRTELYGKEVMPCILSLLGHLPMGVKEKIWTGEYIDLLTLLPSSKEFFYKIKKIK